MLNHVQKIRLYKIIFHSDTKAGKLFDVVLLYCITASVLIAILDSVKNLHNALPLIFITLEWIFTILFSIEYILRIYVSPRPSRYIFSFYGVIDLLSVLPTYLGFFISGYQFFITIRILRLLRVFRIFRLLEFTREGQLLVSSVRNAFPKITFFFLFIISMVVILGTLMYVIEGGQSGFESIPKAIYWAIVTITTVGYGDVVPNTVLGKFLSSFIMLLGYSIIAVPTGIVTAEISKSALSNKTKVCPHCDQELPVEAIYCYRCGNRLIKNHSNE
ncbi:MAG: ion transporter [Thermaurantimonas sp.]